MNFLNAADAMLFDNLKDIHNRISRAALRAGRCPGEVRLIAVTKTVRPELIVTAIESGQREFGENRVQEARDKIEKLTLQISGIEVVWHLIGHLQKNKAKIAVELFDLIHSVDSAELAEVIDRHAEHAGKVQDILLQVKLSEEENKHGAVESEIYGMLDRISGMKSLKILGLMTIPPFYDQPEKARPYFRRLREIRESAEVRGYHLKELSMGMSGDFEIAVEEGATMVRIGSSIFGERRTQ